MEMVQSRLFLRDLSRKMGAIFGGSALRGCLRRLLGLQTSNFSLRMDCSTIYSANADRSYLLSRFNKDFQIMFIFQLLLLWTPAPDSGLV